MIPKLISFAILFIGAAGALRVRHPLIRHLNTYHQRERTFQHLTLLQQGDDSTPINCSTDPNILTSYFTQPLDHFSNSTTNNSVTFGQRYFHNWRFFSTSTPLAAGRPVVFLMIGGEGTMSKQWVCWQNYTYMLLAAEVGAVVVQLEHRFFGINQQMPDLSTPNLAYLTTEQALEDIAAFIPGFTAAYSQNLTNAVWVAFGGSYPGTIAALLRSKYPQLTIGAIASSAPLWAKVDFWEYSAVMERTINVTSPICYANVKQAFADLRVATLSDEGRATITSSFGLNSTLKANPLDITTFLTFVFSAFQGIIQYTYDGRNIINYTNLTIAKACDLMNDDQNGTLTLIDRLSKVFFLDLTLENGYSPSTPLTVNVTYQDNLIPLLNTQIEGNDYAADRGWLWLSCSEFGWHQTTDKSNSLFGDIISVGYYYQLCYDVFGPPISSSYVDAQVAATLRRNGPPSNYTASNIVLPNGALDPWSALGTYATNNDTHQLALLTAGAAHCSDMYPVYDGEPAALAATREVIKGEVRYYLNSTATGGGAKAAAGVGMWAAIIMVAVAVMVVPY